MITAESLGSAEFRRDYGVRYAYLAGAMFKGIASTRLVARMGEAGLMGFFGSGGLRLSEVEEAIRELEQRVPGRYGMNLLATPDDPAAEREIVDMYLRHGVRFVEAAAFTAVTAGVVHYRYQDPRNHLVAKVSRPEVAEAFMSPAPEQLVERLTAEGALTPAQALTARTEPVALDVCVEADSGGHTDAGSPFALIPAMVRLRDDMMVRHGYARRIRVGAAGGLGSPESVAAAFVLGADFVVTGSVNQCTPEAQTSDAVKDLLATLDIQDTAYAPAGDMFELGARVQVVRRGTLFAARANKLYQLYRQHESLDELDAATREQIERRFFGRSIAQVWAETEEYLRKNRYTDLERARRSPKARMAQVFRWYFVHSTRAALRGDPGEKANFQIHCGPALGAFNRFVAGTELRDWRRRHCDTVAELLMTGAAEHLRSICGG